MSEELQLQGCKSIDLHGHQAYKILQQQHTQEQQELAGSMNQVTTHSRISVAEMISVH